MMSDKPLPLAIQEIALPNILLGHRVIAKGDEFQLLPEEQASFSNSVVKVRRSSGAARIVARNLLEKLGEMPVAVMKAASGAPIWPVGVVGSLSHDAEIAVAAVARQHDYLSLGIDVEPAEPLELDLLGIIATASERAHVSDGNCRGRALFAVKEAVYKAVFPLDGVFLDHHDVEVNFENRTATVLGKRIICFRCCIATHILALAYVPTAVATI